MIKIIDLHFQDRKETIATFLIETSDGPVLVETGPHSRISYLEAGLKEHGYSSSDVKHVILTHIHLDHAGAAWYFADKGANIYLHPVGVPHMADPSRLMASAKRIYQDQMDYLWGDMRAIAADQLIEVGHEESITIGNKTFVAHHTPGHASHHIAWQIENELIAGDLAGVKIGNGPVVPPCPPPDINIEAWKASIEHVLQLDLQKIYLVHFGVVANVEEHMNQVVEVLDSWANWMLPFAERQTEQKEIVPLFMAFVARQLKKKGLSDEEIKLYEIANPSWMSVAGLMRYWKKKFQNS